MLVREIIPQQSISFRYTILPKVYKLKLLLLKSQYDTLLFQVTTQKKKKRNNNDTILLANNKHSYHFYTVHKITKFGMLSECKLFSENHIHLPTGIMISENSIPGVKSELPCKTEISFSCIFPSWAMPLFF